MLVEEGIARSVRGGRERLAGGLQPHVLADRGEFHLRRDHAPAGIGQLCDGAAAGAQRFAGRELAICGLRFRISALLRGELGMGLGQVAVVDRQGRAAGVLLNVVSFANPGQADGRQAEGRVLVKCRVAPRSGGVVDAHGPVVREAAVEAAGRLEHDLAHGHAHVRARAGDVDAAGGGRSRCGGAVLSGRAC